MTNAELIRDPDRADCRLLRVDGTDQSHVDLGDPEHLDFDYMRHISYVVDAMAPPKRPVRALHLGAGALTLPRYIAATRPGSYQQAVDIDAEMIALVRERAPLPRRVKVKVRIGDAREQLTAAPDDCYELIVVDVFAGGRTPAHLTTVEFLAEAVRVLRPDGTLIMNTGDGGAMRYARSMTATMRSLLRYGCVLGGAPVLRGRRFGNIVLAGSTRPLDTAAIARRTAGDVFPTTCLDDAGAAAFASGAPVGTDAAPVPCPTPPRLF